MGNLLVFGIIWLVYHLIKEACEPTIPASHWNNYDLMFHDRVYKGLSAKEMEKNIRDGKYK